MGKLIFIGGNRGIGKTELSLRMSKEISFDYVQYSRFCAELSDRLYGASDWVTISRNSQEIHKKFIDYVRELSNKGIIVDGHYSYYNSPPFSDEEFTRLIGDSTGLLILLRAPIELIIKRIRKDPRDRSLKRAEIQKDLDWNYKMYSLYLSKALEKGKLVKGVILENIYFDKCFQESYRTIRDFFNT